MGKTKERITYYPVHHHDFWEVLYQLEGEGDITIDGNVHRFQEGDICVLPPGTLHEKRSESGFIDMSMMVKEMNPLGDYHYKILRDDNARSVLKLFEMGYYLYCGDSPVDQIHLFAVLNSIGESIYQFLAGIYSANNAVTRTQSIEGFVERMYANISNIEFNLASEIEKYGYNVVYFRRLFKSSMHMTPTAYMNKIRIDYAKKEFETYGDSRTIKTTALASGFADPFYFNRLFHRQEGMSPTEYIQQMRKRH